MNAATTPEVAEADLEIGDIDSYVARCRSQKDICQRMALEAMDKAFQAHLNGNTMGRILVRTFLREAQDHILGEDYWSNQEFQYVMHPSKDDI